MRLPPVEVLLKWPTPNYDNPVTRGKALVVVNSVCIGLVILIVGLRLYTRLIIKRWFGLDDIFILLALGFTILLTAVVLLANQQYGWDRHVYDIPFTQLVPASKIAMTAKVVFTAAATFTRLSLQCFYYRLVSDSGKKWFKWLIHANVAYTVTIFISFTFLSIFQCTPVRDYWTLDAPEGNCLDEGKVTLVCGVINCVADFVTTVTPMPLVLGLRMPRRQRLAVAVLFGMGFTVTVAGIVRTWYIYRSLIGEYDQTWYAYPLWIAAAIEIDLGVICASAPVLRPLLSKIHFNRTETFSRGISIPKNSNGYASHLTPQVSRTAPGASVTPLKRRSEAIRAAPELSDDKGKSYELKHWADAELGLIEDESERRSQEAILESGGEGQIKISIARIWDRVRARSSKPDFRLDMTITRTSEVELHIEPATSHNSKRSSRHDRRPETKELPPLPPLPLGQATGNA